MSAMCRVAMGIRTRKAADPWFFWKLAATSCADVAAVLAVNYAAQPDQPLHRSEAVINQVLVLSSLFFKHIRRCSLILNSCAATARALLPSATMPTSDLPFAGAGDAAERTAGGLCHGAVLETGTGRNGGAADRWRPGVSAAPAQVLADWGMLL